VTQEAKLPSVVGEELELVDVRTGERLPATVENAARVIETARGLKRQIDEVVRDATAYLIDESKRLGTKTFHAPSATLSLQGGSETVYDAEKLRDRLRAAGCPEERIAEAVKEEISYKVDRRVLRSLAGANDAYRAAIESAAETVEKAIYASLK
jgi:hypothetical protein